MASAGTRLAGPAMSAMKVPHCGEGSLPADSIIEFSAITELCEVMGFQLSSCGADSTISRYCVSSLFCLMERENDQSGQYFSTHPMKFEFELGDNPKVTATASNCPRFLP